MFFWPIWVRNGSPTTEFDHVLIALMTREASYWTMLSGNMRKTHTRTNDFYNVLMVLLGLNAVNQPTRDEEGEPRCRYRAVPGK